MNTVPMIEVPADKLVASFHGTNNLSCMLSGLTAVLQLLCERADDSVEAGALWAALDIAEKCEQQSDSIQWGSNVGYAAENLLKGEPQEAQAA